MHVGIVSPCSSGPLADLLPDSGGVDIGCGVHFMTTVVRSLVKRGHRVSVITLSPELVDRKILKGPDLTYYVYPMRTARRMRDVYALECRGLKDGILLAKPEILHAHWTYEFALACLMTNLPVLVTTHDNAFQQVRFSKDLFRLAQLFIQIYVIRKARCVTAVSPYLADSLRWLARAKIQMIPNPIEVTKNNFKRASGPVKIATVLNGWGKRKNPKTAIKAFSLLRRELPDAQLSMFGQDFEEGGPASRWATRHKLNRNIQFHGFLRPSDLQTKLKEISVLLQPALEEACPLALLEAMAFGIPVVAGDNAGGVPWVLDGGRAGFLTDVENPKKLSETLLTAIQNVEECEHKRKHAFDRVMSVFSPDAIAEQYEKLYVKVLNSYERCRAL